MSFYIVPTIDNLPGIREYKINNLPSLLKNKQIPHRNEHLNQYHKEYDERHNVHG